MYKRKITRALIAAIPPTLLPLAALAMPGSGEAGNGSASLTRAAQKSRSSSPVNAGATARAAVAGASTQSPSAALRAAGKALLPDGKPCAHGEVYVGWFTSDGKPGFHKIECDANGAFDATLTVPIDTRTGSVTIAALRPGQGFMWQDMAANDSNLSHLELRLQPGVTLEGHLVRADGSPAADTPVHLQSLIPRVTGLDAPSDTPERQIDITRTFGNNTSRFRMGRRSAIQSGLLSILPPEALAVLCQATADANGKFTLTGVPREATVTLAPAAPLVMTAGSAYAVFTRSRERQSVGVFVATGTGSIKARVVDETTGLPAGKTPVQIVHSDTLMPALSTPERPGAAALSPRITDASGEFTLPDLLPGDYKILAPGHAQTVHVQPDGKTTLVTLKANLNALKGRVLDADGKPVANAVVHLLTRPSSGQPRTPTFGITQNVVFNTFGNRNVTFNGQAQIINGRMIQMQSGEFFSAGQFGQQSFQLNTDTNGNFAFSAPRMSDGNGNMLLPDFMQGSQNITIRAVRGNEVAEWNGSVEQIGSGLKLQLRPDVLVSVTGRLVDPQRRPVANAVCTALHWLPTSRATWFATARPVSTDADGNFRVEGLERGESFSIITTGQNTQNRRGQAFAHNAAISAGAARNGGNGAAPKTLLTQGAAAAQTQTASVTVQDFESPRFLTCRAGDRRSAQNIGEVMVHPSDTPQEVMQSYGEDDGTGSPGDLPGLLVTPAAPAIKEARQALARWEDARQNGDVHAMLPLTSHVSPGWTADTQAYLQQAGLCRLQSGDASTENLRALRFVPRRAAAAILSAAPADVRAATTNMGAGDDALAHSADWVFFVRPATAEEESLSANDAANEALNSRVELAGAMHREDGQWRVVANPFLGSALPVLSSLGALDASTLTCPAPPAGENAQQAGERYLQTWLAGSKEELRAQTSKSAAFFAPDPAAFRARLEKRADGGVCPLASDEQIALQPIADMTEWEQEWVRRVARNNPFAEMSFVTGRVSLSNTASRTGAGGASRSAGRAATAAHKPVAPIMDDIAAFRYKAQGHEFLMVLQRRNAVWEALEPALPL